VEDLKKREEEKSIFERKEVGGYFGMRKEQMIEGRSCLRIKLETFPHWD